MNLIDRAIATISPERALRRTHARVRIAAASSFFFGRGGYNAARGDRPALKEWNPPNGSADHAASPDLAALRARTHDLDRNNPIAGGALDTFETSVVGSGLVPHPRIDRALLGLNDDAADRWERQAERIWWSWAGTSACDLSRTDNFAGLCNLALRSWLAGGDVFVIRRFKERDGDVLALRIQLVEAERICNPDFARNSDRLIDGVQIDDDGAPIAYYVADSHPIGSYGLLGPCGWRKVDAFGKDSGMRQVLHLYRRTRPGQTRGIPIFAPVIESLKQLDRFSEAELMAAVINAFFTVFVKSETGEEGLTDMGDPSTAGGTTPIGGGLPDVRLGHANAIALPPGHSIEMAESKRPSPQFEPFFNAFLNQIGVAIGLPHELLIKRFQSSYSASRAAFLEAWRGFLTRRSWLVDRFCQPSYEWVIGEAVARGKLVAPGFLTDPLIRAAWCQTQWTGPAQGQIDPLNEIQAAEKRVNLRIQSRQDIATEMFGSDWEPTFKQLAKERRMLEEAGLDSEDVSERFGAEVPSGAPAVSAPPRKPGEASRED